MKHTLKSLILCSSAVALLASCSKLKEDVYSSVFTTNFYKSAQDAEAALTAASAALALEQEVANAAAAVRLIATAAARDLAAETDAKAAEVALVARTSQRS